MLTQEKRKLKGLCTKCGEIPEVKGSLKCNECIQYFRLKANERHKKRKESGCCTRCNVFLDLENTKTQCKSCWNKSLQSAQKTNQRKAATGVCRCGDRALFNLKYCQKCKDRSNTTQKERLAHKICTECGNKAVRRHKHCLDCRGYVRNLYNNYIAPKSQEAVCTPEIKAKNLLNSYQKMDRQKNRLCDLDLTFVLDKLKSSCSYCGESYYMNLGLDRIDNSVGHIKSNVMTCCKGCNYTRRDMPYEAWLIVARGIKEAKTRGLLK